MKSVLQFIFLLAMLFTVQQVDGQNRKVLVEHFTNSKCPICKSNNPGFYTRFNNYKSNAIHMAIYSSVPYSSCAIHQANVAGSNAREALYDIPGAPTVILDGKKGASNLPSDNDYINAIARPAEYSIQFIDPNPGQVRVRVITLNALPDGATLQAFVALTQKQFEYTGSNGESLHYDVFRKFLKDANSGVEIIFPAGSQAGDVIEYDFGPVDYTMAYANEYNLISFINRKNSKDILQSEITEIGPGAGINKIDLKEITLNTFPNPVTNLLSIDWKVDDFKPEQIRIFNDAGQQVFESRIISSKNKTTIDVHSLSPGLYLYKLASSGNIIGYGKFIVK